MHSPQRSSPSLGLTPDADSLRQWQATRFHFAALRQPGHLAPASHATARDGDLARVDARHRYDQTTQTRQMMAEKARQARLWQALREPAKPQYALSQTPNEDYYKPEAVRQRAVAHRLAQQHAQLVADHPLEAQVGEGVVIGSNIVTSTVLSEVALLRLAGGLRWVGATRAALAVRSTTLAGATEETFGVGASIKQYGSLSLKQRVVLTSGRGAIDFIGQGAANYYGSDKQGVSRFVDAANGVNLVESALAGANVRPVGLGITSALVQYSRSGGFRTPFNNTVTWQAAGAQAGAAIGMGYIGLSTSNLLSKRVAYQLYHQSALRVGHEAAYPVWLGSAHLFRTVIPVGLGGATSLGQNAASAAWPAPPSLPPPPSIPQP